MEKLNNILKSIEIVTEMLADRKKYENPIIEKDCSLEKIKTAEFPIYFFPSKREKISGILVWWHISPVGASEVKQYCNILTSRKLMHCIIIIIDGKITPKAKLSISDLRRLNIIIETFFLEELQINITKHEKVPKHIPLSKKEAEKLLENYNVKKEDFPGILLNDPQIRYLGVKKGTIIKIIRKNTACPSINIENKNIDLSMISYRVVR